MAPNGVSIRLPPANGLEGSAVWQLAQSPATLSTSPLAIVSLEGSAPAFRLNALHKERLRRIARPSRRHPCIERPSPLQYGPKAAVTSFRAANFSRHNRKTRERHRTRNCVLRRDLPVGEICCAAG